jgi:hypothetical protein
VNGWADFNDGTLWDKVVSYDFKFASTCINYSDQVRNHRLKHIYCPVLQVDEPQ